MSEYRLVSYKPIKDDRGYWTEYCWFKNIHTEEHLFFIGEHEYVDVEIDWPDRECDSEWEAAEWFDDYDADDSYEEEDYEPEDYYDGMTAFGWHQQDIIDSYRSQR